MDDDKKTAETGGIMSQSISEGLKFLLEKLKVYITSFQSMASFGREKPSWRTR